MCAARVQKLPNPASIRGVRQQHAEINSLRHSRERIVHGAVGVVVRIFQLRAYEPSIINRQFVACLRAGPGDGTDDFAGDAVAHTVLSSLSSLSSHISTRAGRVLKGGQQPAKGKVLKLIKWGSCLSTVATTSSVPAS
jgi:hypothetical protein